MPAGVIVQLSTDGHTGRGKDACCGRRAEIRKIIVQKLKNEAERWIGRYVQCKTWPAAPYNLLSGLKSSVFRVPCLDPGLAAFGSWILNVATHTRGFWGSGFTLAPPVVATARLVDCTVPT